MLPGYQDRLIPEDPSDRTPLPESVFCYPMVSTWRGRVWGMLSDLIDDRVIENFKKHPPEYVVSDDLSWLDKIISTTLGIDTDIKEVTAERLQNEFQYFRAAHATRTDDLSQFYKNGLKILRASTIEDRARVLFLNGRFPEATEHLLQKAIDDIDARNLSCGREGRLYFCAVEENLFTRYGSAGHYLIYGSEYLYCIGTRVAPHFSARKILSEIGRPTLFVCDIPFDLMRHATVKEFAGMILEYLFCEIIDGQEAHALSPGAGSALSLTVDLPASFIVGHYHPAKIYDPLWNA